MKKKKNDDVRIVPLDAYPGKPPKNYKKKRAVSLFVCFLQSFGPACYELIRVKTTARSDDMYSIYYPRTQRDANFHFHESIHDSGEIHLVMNERNVGTPAYGRKDNPAAMRLYLRVKQPLCLCIRMGKSLGEDQLRQIVFRIAEHLPIKVDGEEATQELLKRGFYRLVREDLKISTVLGYFCFISFSSMNSTCLSFTYL
jgi:hypothetical protein